MNVTVNTNRVRGERVAAGLSQQEMADKLHISRSTYQRYESGSRKIGADMIGNITQILNISPQRMYIFFNFNVPERQRSIEERSQ